MLERAQYLSGPVHEYAFQLRELVVFGSYRTGAPDLGDLDLAARWAPRYAEWQKHWDYCQERIVLAHRRGRAFSNYSEELRWPLSEAQRYLRGRNGLISVQDLGENGDLVLRTPHRWLVRDSVLTREVSAQP